MKKPIKTKELQPTDSTREASKDNQVVKNEEDKTYKREDATMPNPEKKRKFSEQPPTKHNTHN